MLRLWDLSGRTDGPAFPFALHERANTPQGVSTTSLSHILAPVSRDGFPEHSESRARGKPTEASRAASGTSRLKPVARLKTSRPLKLEDPLDIDRDGDEHESSQGRRGTGSGDEEVAPIAHLIGGHAQNMHVQADGPELAGAMRGRPLAITNVEPGRIWFEGSVGPITVPTVASKLPDQLTAGLRADETISSRGYT